MVKKMKKIISLLIVIMFTTVVFAADYDSLFQLGEEQLHAGKFQDAIKSFTKAIELHPNAKAYYSPQVSNYYELRGLAYARLNEFKQAIDDFDNAIKLNPDFTEAYYNRGGTYGKTGDDKKGIDDIKTAAKMGYKPAQELLKINGVDW